VAAENGQSLRTIDCEAYWDFKTQHPSSEKHEQGANSKDISFEVKPFGKSIFGTGMKVYLGLYSRSGCHIKIACSFG
jgi:hypothetical protein